MVFYEFVLFFKDGYEMSVYSTDIQGTIHVIETEIENLERWTMHREKPDVIDGDDWEAA